MFKIAYCAGHYLGTLGKRVPKQLDPNQTREWTLNDRIADHFAQAASEYEGVELLRVDDSTGKKHISIANRTAKANAWGADFYLDIHHNAGVKLGKGGGVVAFSYPGSVKGAEYRNAIYDAVVKAGGLRGNRSNPKAAKAYTSLKRSKCTAVLMEYGFMDSITDYPVISKDSYSRLVAYATMEAIAEVAGLKKKLVKPVVKPIEHYTLKEFVTDIQKAIGATVDGIPGPETLSKTVTVSAKKNNKHAVVKFIQKRLLALGYTEVGKADGVAGPKFTSAVAHFQMDNHCVTDGEITAKNTTWKKLLGLV